MEKQLFRTRGEMTGQMIELMKQGLTCYRVRVACDCKPELLNPEMNLTAHQRNGVLVIDGETVKMLFIKCIGCWQSSETETEQKTDL